MATNRSIYFDGFFSPFSVDNPNRVVATNAQGFSQASDVTYSELQAIVTGGGGNFIENQDGAIQNGKFRISGSGELSSLKFSNGSFVSTVSSSVLTANRTITYPDDSGTLALQAEATAAKARANHTGTQAPSTIVQDASNRFTTDAEKAVWNAKESTGNKATNFTVLNNTLYPSVKAVSDAIALMGSASFMGAAKPTDNPGAQTTPKYWIAAETGTYTNFGGAVVAANSVAVLAWNGAAWTVSAFAMSLAGYYQKTEVYNKAEVDDVRLLKKIGKNLFDKSLTTDNFYLNGSGVLVALAGYYVSGFIPAEPNTDYSLTNIGSNAGGGCTVFYAADKSVLSFVTGSSIVGNKITTPTGCYYVRLSSSSIATKVAAQVEKGTSQTVYDPYTDYTPIPVIQSQIDILNNTVLLKIIGKNLFNKDSLNIINGFYLNNVGGQSANASYFISDFIPVLPSTAYISSNFSIGGAYCAVYDINKLFVSSFNTNGVTTPANGYYIRMSGTIVNKAIQQVEKGTVATSYEPYTDYVPVGAVARQVPDRDTVCVLPKKLYFVKNKLSSVYYENCLLKNLNDPTSLYFNKGTNYNRQVAFNFNAGASAQAMTSQVVRSLKQGELKNFTYEVIDPVVNNGKTANILCIGDSFTDIGTWVKECKTLLTAQGVTVNQIGTNGDASFKAEGLSGGTLANTFLNSSKGVARIVQVTGVTTLPESGYPGAFYKDTNNVQWLIRGGKIDGSGNGKIRVTKDGAVAGDFTGFPSSGTLTKVSGVGDAVINYSSPVAAYFNPFLNHSTGVLDIANYITYWGFSAPNIVAFQFTWNDLAIWQTDANIQTLVNSFKTAADHVHAAYPSAKVIFSIEPCGSVNGNLQWNGKKYSVLRFAELMLTAFEDDAAYNTWVKIAPAYAFVDLVNGYSNSTVAPSDRFPLITEVSGGDGVHPSDTGMKQIADCVYQVMQHLL